MLARMLRLFSLSALALSALSGCLIIREDFMPSGNDSTVRGSWTIEGSAPTPGSCAALGIDVVRIAFFDGTRPVYLSSLQAPCGDGMIAPGGPVLRAGTYQVRFEAWRASSLVASGNMQTVTAVAGGHVELTPANFTSGTGFNPLGSDATIAATWTIDGAAASASTCAALGIDQLRIAFYNAGSPFYDSSLDAPCAAGQIDSRPTPIIAAGSYTIRLEAFRAGTRIAEGPMVMQSVTPGGHVMLSNVDFTSGTFDPRGTDATLSASWTFNGRAPTASSCFAIGVDYVRVLLCSTTDALCMEGIEIAQADCAMGSLDTRPMPVIAAGSYYASVELIDFAGESAGSFEPGGGPFAIAPGSHMTILPADFPFPTTLTIGLDWIRSPGGPTGTPGTCAEAGVVEMDYTLTRAGDLFTISSGGHVACGELVTFNMMDDALTSGTWSFKLNGYDSAGASRARWTNSDCTDIVIGNGELRAEQCIGDYILIP